MRRNELTLEDVSLSILGIVAAILVGPILWPMRHVMVSDDLNQELLCVLGAIRHPRFGSGTLERKSVLPNVDATDPPASAVASEDCAHEAILQVYCPLPAA
jgi:hypothetical protein